MHYLGFGVFMVIVASWKQRRKPAPYHQPAGDGPTPGYTHMHTLSHCLLLLLNSCTRFFSRLPKQLPVFPFGERKWRTGAMTEAVRRGCRPATVGFLPRWCKKTRARNGFIWCQCDRSFLSRGERMENNRSLEIPSKFVFWYIYYMFQW